MNLAEITFNADQALDKLDKLIQAHGAQAVDVAIQVTQMNAINHIVSAAGWAVAATAVGLGANWLRGKALSQNDELNSFPIWIGFGVLCLVAGLMVLIGVLSPIFDVWTWTGLFEPKLALAHDIMQRIGGQ